VIFFGETTKKGTGVPPFPHLIFLIFRKGKVDFLNLLKNRITIG